MHPIPQTPAVAERVESALGKLDLAQKVRLLTGSGFWGTYPEPLIGLRTMILSDGPAGVRGVTWDERETSVNVPSPTSLAATWDEPLVERIGALLAGEARRKGVDVLLAPTVNLHRTPLGGRHFECYSEDPLLTARIGTAYVRGVQSGGVAATVKHYVANDSETERMTVDVRVDERTLRELYLAPFEEIVRDARPWLVMAAYNGVNGATMTENPLLADPLKSGWGFDGVVVSDWLATTSTAESGRAALDLVMPGPDGPWGSGWSPRCGPARSARPTSTRSCAGSCCWPPASAHSTGSRPRRRRRRPPGRSGWPCSGRPRPGGWCWSATRTRPSRWTAPPYAGSRCSVRTPRRPAPRAAGARG